MKRSSTSCILHFFKSKKLNGVLLGQFSTNIPPIVLKESTKKLSTKNSCSLLKKPINSPYMNRMETIVYFKNFCNVKLFLKKQSIMICNSLLHLSSFMKKNSIQLHNSYHDLTQKLLCFTNEYVY